MLISIRGMNTSDPDPNADPKVSTIIDGVYITFVSSTMLDLFDVERIEILKGPQGVLFGKNNLAGTLNVFSARPADDFGGEARVSLGSFGLKQFRGKVNSGHFAGDALTAKVAVNFRDYNGYSRNVITGNRLNGANVKSVRGALEYDGFDGEELGLTWDGYRADMFVAGDAARSIFDFVRRDKAGGRPWFMVVGLINPHDIMFYDATGEQAKHRTHPDLLAPLRREPGDPIYEVDNKFDLPESFYKDDLSTKPEAHKGIQRLNDLFYGPMPLSDLDSWHRFNNYYYNCLRDVDRRLGQLLWALKESGQIDNTIIMYTSDHGERAAAHGLRQKAGTMYREETNVPMIIAHPDVTGGQTTKGLMGAIDIAPTLMTIAGLSADEGRNRFPNLPGVDVSGLLSSPAAPTERDKRGHFFNYAVAHMWEPNSARVVGPRPPGEKVPDYSAIYDLEKRRLHRGVHDGRWKFARYFAPAHHHQPKDWKTLSTRNDLELYDTHADPKELVNLANDPKHRKEVMRLNAMVNALADREIGAGLDDGREYPGPTEMYNRSD